ncbi:MAG TPA: hypothetical protein DDX85_13790 [Nitrospiraceae bacterium]|nr:hypothetical protein [Nitrospiraceae bacterium]
MTTCVNGVVGDTCIPGTPQAEVCGDAIDQDCSGADLSCADVDGDGDGLTTENVDCNDNDPNIHPGAIEICDDGIDNNCSGEDNQSPVINTFTSTYAPVSIGTSITATADFTDDNPNDVHSVSLDWGDNTTADFVLPVGIRNIEESHTYTGPGVYTITLTVSDGYCGAGFSQYRFVVVFDPKGGSVTGGGWIMSPQGAYPADPSLSGNANFGFVSLYEKGVNIPKGETEFEFKVADLDFHSTTYEWLVVAGAQAKFKGTGQINRTGNYGFMLFAVDGNISGGGGIDKFRIKIWDKDNNDVIVYDNNLNASDDAAPATALSGGAISIKKK